MRHLDHFFSATATTALPTSLAVTLAGHPLSRTSLSRAHFVTQLDQKFLLCRMPLLDASESSVLVAVDQHAAHERVRIESFLSAVFDQAAKEGVESRKLLRPVSVPLSPTEAQAVQRSEIIEEFKRWGIVLLAPILQSRTKADDGSSDVQAKVTEVPTVVAERLQAEPKTLADLVSHHIARLLDDDSMLKRIGGPRSITSKNCPQGLLALLDSKACRGQ
jgi:DNA mismatch repair protein MLH3